MSQPPAAASATDTAALLRDDRDLLWHPYTSLSAPAPVRLVRQAAGVRLLIDDAERGPTWVIDGMASWWCAIHGYRHPRLDAAVRDQVDSMAHVMFGGLTHEPAVLLARRLTELVGLPHVFLCDSGSVSVEVALKMARQFQRGQGRPGRTRLAALAGGYHGDTWGAMSVCDPDGGLHAMWADALTPQVFLPRPPAGLHLADDDPAVLEWARAVEVTVAAHSDALAAVIAEPILQGAGGMHIYPAACLRVLRRVADEHGLLLILDEIATGFGRTGALFGAHHEASASGALADIVCVGKALTGGYLTMGATLCSAEVAAGVGASDAGVLMHGPTFMANPLACAVALASIETLLASPWQTRVAGIETQLAAGLAAAWELPQVRDVRVLGAVGVVHLRSAVDVVRATAVALDHGVWLRPFRDLVYCMPPFISDADDIAQITAGMLAAARAA